MARIDVVSASAAGWEAVEAVLTADASTRNCWCQFHVLENRVAKQTTRQSRKVLLRDQVTTLDPPRGLVALCDGKPAGWCGVEPRLRLGHALASRLVTRSSPYPRDDPGVWVIYCIFVPRGSRGRGVATSLLRSAIVHAGENGARSIEGYPIDTAGRDGILPQGVSTGSLSMFEAEGFRAVDALPSGRTLVALDL